jgi:A/G-specific adenine glycosylase
LTRDRKKRLSGLASADPYSSVFIGGSGFCKRLLAWYRRHRRALPWRETRDPYRIWVSEIMLQQTRVSAVIPYYQRFLERFPTVKALAAAPEQELLECWSGLGYYRRARQMQQAARRVAAEHGGVFPDTLEALQGLPGIGGYTAAAIASIAFGRPHAVVDGNVIRVLTRLFDDGRDVTRSATRSALAARAQQLLDCVGRGDYGHFNQAVMELGAMICTPRGPQCLICPVAEFCLSRRNGSQLDRPRKKAKEKAERLDVAVVVVRRGARLLMRQRPADSAVMPGFWELPQAEGARLDAGCFWDLGIESDGLLGEFRHTITFRSYRGRVFGGVLAGRSPQGYRWVPQARLIELPVTTITRKALAAAARAEPGGGDGRNAPARANGI